jgi:HAD superfamily hydrolase (TIGR01509 family)
MTDPRHRFRAVVFDFDGLILDTETPEFRAWQEEFARVGADFDVTEWVGIVGTHSPDLDLLETLRRRADGQFADGFDPDEITARRRERKMTLVYEEALRPGITDRLDDAARLGLRVGIASTSRRGWVTGHLDRLGLRDRFDAVVGRDDVDGVAKPAPDVYLEVVSRLGCEPGEAVAIEDSAHGLVAAHAAGLATIAVPNEITRHLDLSAADLVVDSLADASLEELLRSVRDGRGQAGRTSRSTSS